MPKRFKFLFNTKTPSYLGTRRLFFDDLASDLKKLNHFVQQDYYENYQNFDIAIVKSSDFLVDQLREGNSRIKIGLVHPSNLTKDLVRELKNADFIISGSIEESDIYLKYNPNIFILPHIEKYTCIGKKHTKKDTYIIGYHGNKMHLEEFYPKITLALEKLSHEFKITFKAIYNIEKLGLWEKGRPKIPIQDIQWDWSSCIHECNLCDVGIVNCFVPIEESKEKAILIEKENFRNDYIVRYKSSSNAGRAFVFAQAGVPVIADMTPENCQFIFHNYNGFLVHSEYAWYHYLKVLLTDATLRQKFSNNSRAIFTKKFDRLTYVKNFISFLHGL